MASDASISKFTYTNICNSTQYFPGEFRLSPNMKIMFHNHDDVKLIFDSYQFSEMENCGLFIVSKDFSDYKPAFQELIDYIYHLNGELKIEDVD